MKKIYIIGAGTLGCFIADIIESLEIFQVGGFFDDNYPKKDKALNYPIIGKINDIKPQKINLAIGVGDPKFRKLIIEKEILKGNFFPSIVHSSTVLSKYSKIEEGVILGPNSSVLNGSVIKRGACLLSHVNVNQDVEIGPFSLVGAGVVIGNNVVLGDGVHLGLGVKIKLNQKVPSWSYIEE